MAELYVAHGYQQNEGIASILARALIAAEAELAIMRGDVEFKMLCPTCGGLPCDARQIRTLEAELAEWRAAFEPGDAHVLELLVLPAVAMSPPTERTIMRAIACARKAKR